jgi:hypothetical protein
MLLILASALLLADADTQDFPEQVPGLMAACLADAVVAGDVTDTEESHKYICAGEAAEELWHFLERAEVRSYEQDTPEGRWLSRDFPLGGCFKRIRMPDGAAATSGLSCTIWVPRPKLGAAVSKP